MNKLSSPFSPSKLITVGFTSILIALFIVLLSLIKTIAVPFVVAMLLMFIYIHSSLFMYQLLSKIKRIAPFKKLRRTAANLLTILVFLSIIMFLYNVVNSSLTTLIDEAPNYQKILNNKISALVNKVDGHEDTYEIGRKGDSSISFSVKNMMIEPLRMLKMVNSHKVSTWFRKNIDIRYIINSLGTPVKTLATNGTLIIIYLIFIALEGRNIKAKHKSLCNMNPSMKMYNSILSNIDNSLVTYLKIKAASSFFTGFISYIILASLGVYFAPFWGLLIFVLNFIPTVGSIVAVLFPITLAIIQFNTITPIILTITLLGSVQFAIGNIIEPRYMGTTLNLSPLVILISLAVWGKIWGILGMFLSVPIMVSINIILAQFSETRAIAIILSANGNIKPILNNEED